MSDPESTPESPPEPSVTPAIDARGLTKVFRDGVPFRALDGVDLTVRPGELIAIMGPSGSGKSTLLRMIAGLEVPDGGQVLIAGEDVNRRSGAPVYMMTWRPDAAPSA